MPHLVAAVADGVAILTVEEKRRAEKDGGEEDKKEGYEVLFGQFGENVGFGFD